MTSLLEQLQKKRQTLQATKTIVTTATGKRFEESHCSHQHLTILKPLDEQTHGFVVDTSPDAVPVCILKDFLYLGSQDAVSLDNIKQYNLTHILSIGINTPIMDASNQDINSLYLPCLDLPETNIFTELIPKSLEYINSVKDCGGKVLVHCNAGVSRSATVVIAYLMQKNQIDFDTAYQLVKSKRSCIQPNIGFISQLKQFSCNINTETI